MTISKCSEVWLPVVGSNGHTYVSDRGRMRRGTRGPITKGGISKDGRGNEYCRYFMAINGERRQHPVHRLVLATFVGPCPVGCLVYHRNGNSKDNRLDNLGYVTRPMLYRLHNR